MKKVFFLLTLFIAVGTAAQDLGVVKGNIVDFEANNEPLLLANVRLKHTAWSTQTNFNGNFEMVNVTPGKYIAEVSFLGYETLEIAVEVAKNKVTRLEKGLKAQTLSLGELTGILAKTTAKVVASVEKEE